MYNKISVNQICFKYVIKMFFYFTELKLFNIYNIQLSHMYFKNEVPQLWLMVNITMFEHKAFKLSNMFTFYYEQLLSVYIHWQIFYYFGKIFCVIKTPIT